MKNYRLLSILLGLFILVSCQKDEEITKMTKRNAMVSIRVVDENDRPVKGSEVFIGVTSDSNLTNSILLKSGVTDENGLFKYESFLQYRGIYYGGAAVTDGKINYEDIQLFSFTTRHPTRITLSPGKNVGSLTVQLTNDQTRPMLNPGVNIAVIPQGTNYQTVEEVESAAHFMGITDRKGYLRIGKIPANYPYRIVLYNKMNSILYQDEFFYVSRGEDKAVGFEYPDETNF